ncbi:uncharacterized protein SPSK_05499 [Sporothrix schenckii 1099-18]|uniref:Uncharacterized protein n=1 Tax=Sporothrix schenckii 1099-18 TaxID=1397361 RepID=A0A0F2LRV1_SPOSC|nr:uncharacterized protein SPSK_05499 [Sporothrix schenckii 1099-18]KJR80258.1 hypothetical protein SPSK_05499 [Sporothrix schenckii 1099-18]
MNRPRNDMVIPPFHRRQIGVSSSNPFSHGNGFPGSGGNDNGGSSGGANTDTNTGTGNGSGSGSGGDGGGNSGGTSGGTSGSGTSGSGGTLTSGGGTTTTGGSSDTLGSGYDSGRGPGNGPGSGYSPGMSGPNSNAIAGIAVGSVLAFFLIAAVLIWLCTRQWRRQQLQLNHEQQVLAKSTQAHRPDHHTDDAASFAKEANGSRVQLPQPDLPTLPDDPPPYEESQQQRRVYDGGHIPSFSQSNATDIERAVGSVSDGFRQYSPPPPVIDASNKGNLDTPERRPEHGQQL